MPVALAPEQRAAILEDIKARDGRSARVIGKARGVSDATVRRIAKEAGLTDVWTRDDTKRATEANAIDHAAVLVKLAARHASVAGDILASFEAMTLGDWSSVSPHTRAIALGICSDKARELAPADDEGQIDAAKSLLGAVMDNLMAKHA